MIPGTIQPRPVHGFVRRKQVMDEIVEFVRVDVVVGSGGRVSRVRERGRVSDIVQIGHCQKFVEHVNSEIL